MKRLTLLLGSLLVVSAAASAKEVVPAPVVVEETPVQVVTKEVIVYRDKAPEWRPNGYVQLEQSYYGETEKHDNEDKPLWNEHNRYTKTTAQAKVALTKDISMDMRARLNQKTTENGKGKTDDFRVRLFANHAVGTSQLSYENKMGDGLNKVSYKYTVDFSKYFFNNDFIKTTSAEFGPKVSYTWDKNAGVGRTYFTGLYANFNNTLPYGFGVELELDNLGYSNTNSRKYAHRDVMKRSQWGVEITAKLTHGANLYANGPYSIDWAFEGGYDTLDITKNKRIKYNKGDHTKYGRTTYQLYAQPSVTATYKATQFVDLYATVGAEYRNWTVYKYGNASHWRWQPYATVGVKTTF